MSKYEPKYFSIAELTRSETAKLRGIDNTPTAEVEEHLMGLIENVLDPLRQWWGSAISVSSGYRCAKLNTAVGGSKTSWHLLGCAADIYVGYVGNKTAHKQLLEHIKTALPFSELIWENGGAWIHVAYYPGKITKQVKSMWKS